MGSGQAGFAGCVIWCGLIAGGAACGVLLSIIAEFVWPTSTGDSGPLAGVGLIGVGLLRAVLTGLSGAVFGGVVAGWTVGRLRRSGDGRA
jgi:hypothetical protein